MKYIILVCSLLLFFSAQSQQRKFTPEQYAYRGDSVVSGQMLQKMRLIFTVTEVQEKNLRRAIAAGSQKRRALLSQHDTTKVFRERMINVERTQDSLYESIVGKANYALYKAAVQQERQQRKGAMEERMQRLFGKFDSTKLKAITNEKQ